MKNLIGIVAPANEANAVDPEYLRNCVCESGFECVMLVVDPLRETEKLREWVDHCQNKGALALIALDDKNATLGIMTYGFTNLPVLRVPADNTTTVSHLPAVATLEQALLHLARFNIPKPEFTQAAPAPEPQQLTPEKVNEDEGNDADDLERLGREFKNKSWLKSDASATPESIRPAPHTHQMVHDYTPHLRAAITLSRHIALNDKTDEITPQQLFKAILATDDSAASEAVRHCCNEPQILYKFLADVPHVNLKKSVKLIPLASNLMEAIAHAKKTATSEERPYIDTYDVLLAMLRVEKDLTLLLQDWGVDVKLLVSRDLPIKLTDEYEPIRKKEEFRKRILPRKPVSTQEMSQLMQNIPAHLLPAKQPLPGESRKKQAGPIKIILSESSIKEPAELTPNSIRRFSPEDPSLDFVEQVCDTLLGGRVIGMPTDTTYALAVDATNMKAVDKLKSLRAPSEDAPMIVLFDTMTMLQNITPSFTDELREFSKVCWPGPVVIKLPRKKHVLRHADMDGAIYLRQPSAYSVLAFLSMLGRPILIVDSGCDNANKARKQFSNQLAMILDSGTDGSGRETIVDAMGSTLSLFREGEFVPEAMRPIIDKLPRA